MIPQAMRVRLTVAFGLSAPLAAWAVQRLVPMPESAFTAFSNVALIVLAAMAAGSLIRSALKFESDERLRLQLAMIGTSAALWAAGQVVFAFQEVVLGQLVPFPGPADVLFVVTYIPMVIGLGDAVWSFRHVVDLRIAVTGASLATFATSAVAWPLVFVPILDARPGGVELLLDLAYPLADLWLMFAPALTMLFIVVGLRRGRVALPWYWITAGMLLYSLGDLGFVRFTATEAYYTGHPTDLGWTAGYWMMAIGGAVALEVHKRRDVVRIADIEHQRDGASAGAPRGGTGQ